MLIDMKKIVVVLIAVMALSLSASAQRRSVPYAGISIVSDLAERTGAGVAVGFRNYNRNPLVSVGLGAEAYTYFIPGQSFGIFGVPEIGVAIGPKAFKLYPHTGLMFGYDTSSNGFHWGGKDGLAFDFGKNFTLDFSTYLPGYRFSSATYAIGLIWRFGD